jgi:hypothetical protein
MRKVKVFVALLIGFALCLVSFCFRPKTPPKIEPADRTAKSDSGASTKATDTVKPPDKEKNLPVPRPMME